MKKGQVEDIFADLIPAIVILLIVLFLINFYPNRTLQSMDYELLSYNEDIRDQDLRLFLESQVNDNLLDDFPELKGKNLRVVDIIRLRANTKDEDLKEELDDVILESSKVLVSLSIGEIIAIDPGTKVGTNREITIYDYTLELDFINEKKVYGKQGILRSNPVLIPDYNHKVIRARLKIW